MEECKTMHRYADAYIVNVYPNGGNARDAMLSRFVNDSALKEKTENAHPTADKEEILKYLKKYPTASNKELLDKFHTSTKVLSKLRKQINK